MRHIDPSDYTPAPPLTSVLAAATVATSSFGAAADADTTAPAGTRGGLRISGDPPAAVAAGSPYAFQPTVRHWGDEVISFSIQQKPDWATFSTATGALSGTPTSAEVGEYSGIVISASDARSSVSLPAFSITVDEPQAAAGAATLAWTPPTENTNGTTLTNLAGYAIEYGTTAASLSESVTIANPGLTSYMVTGLSAGTWYFGVKAYNTLGAYGALSNVVSKTVQ
jgi:Putative Ig domain